MVTEEQAQLAVAWRRRSGKQKAAIGFGNAIDVARRAHLACAPPPPSAVGTRISPLSRYLCRHALSPFPSLDTFLLPCTSHPQILLHPHIPPFLPLLLLLLLLPLLSCTLIPPDPAEPKSSSTRNCDLFVVRDTAWMALFIEPTTDAEPPTPPTPQPTPPPPSLPVALAASAMAATMSLLSPGISHCAARVFG